MWYSSILAMLFSVMIVLFSFHQIKIIESNGSSENSLTRIIDQKMYTTAPTRATTNYLRYLSFVTLHLLNKCHILTLILIYSCILETMHFGSMLITAFLIVSWERLFFTAIGNTFYSLRRSLTKQPFYIKINPWKQYSFQLRKLTWME